MNLFVLFFVVLAAVSVTSSAFADVTITTVLGSSTPGCENNGGCFIPKETYVDIGEKVIFYNDDTAAHTFTAGTSGDGPSGKFDSQFVLAKNSYEWTATEAGIIPYFCMVHPWMSGTLIVGDYSAPPDIEIPPTGNPTMNQLQDAINNLKSENTNLKIENRQLKIQVDEKNTIIDSLSKQITNLNLIVKEQIKVIYDWVISK